MGGARRRWSTRILALTLAVALATVGCGWDSGSSTSDGPLDKIEASRQRLDAAEQRLCSVVDGATLGQLGFAAAQPSFSNSVLFASCTYGTPTANVTVTLGFDGASMHAPFYEEEGTSPVQVAGARRAAVVDRIIGDPDRPTPGFTVIADIGGDMVEVEVRGRRNDGKVSIAVQLAGQAGKILAAG